jgi:hypothetical protein
MTTETEPPPVVKRITLAGTTRVGTACWRVTWLRGYGGRDNG